MNYKLIDYKNIVKNDKGEDYIDLLSKSYNDNQPLTGTFIAVNNMYIGRPDLISLAVYGSDDYADILCKVNGISNPFELNENDMLFLPSVDYIQNAYKAFDNVDDFIKASEKLSNDPVNKYQKKITEKRMPNEQTEGYTRYIVDKSLGIIFY